MSHRDEIRDLAVAVDSALSAYIEVHERILRDAATTWSLIKNLVDRGVPTSTLLEESKQLMPLWDVIRQRIVAFRESSYSFLSKEEQDYFDLLSRYVDAVCLTVIALVDRQLLLNAGGKGGPHNPMTREAYKEKHRAYEESIRHYMAIGQELTAAGPIIFR
jgi:hypothetical protein